MLLSNMLRISVVNEETGKITEKVIRLTELTGWEEGSGWSRETTNIHLENGSTYVVDLPYDYFSSYMGRLDFISEDFKLYKI